MEAQLQLPGANEEKTNNWESYLNGVITVS